MALGSLLIEPNAALGPVGGTTGSLGVSAKDDTGAAQALPALTTHTSNAGVASITGQTGAYLTVTIAGAGRCTVWVSNGAVDSNKVIIDGIDTASGTSRRQMQTRRGGKR